jgi:hypothetical protein
VLDALRRAEGVFGIEVRRVEAAPPAKEFRQRPSTLRCGGRDVEMGQRG